MERVEEARAEEGRIGPEATQSAEHGATTGGASTRPHMEYEPPRLIRVGSLRTLLGKTGTIPDKGPPFDLHT